MSLLISASTNPPNLENLLEYIKKLDNTDVDYIHCDVMDGKFVKSTTFNHKIVKKIKEITSKKLDVHLMVQKPSNKIKKYIKSGADILTIHFESYKNKNKLTKDLLSIKKGGTFAGLSFNPTTEIKEILPFIYFCDMLLVMSVTPGKSGQEFIESTFDRLKEIKDYLKHQNIEVTIEVDGGVNNKNAKTLKENGVNSVVLGNYLFTSKDLKGAVNLIKNI